MNYELAGARKSFHYPVNSKILKIPVRSTDGLIQKKMKKINLDFLLFWPVISLLSPDICQRVTRNKFKTN